MAKQDHQNPNPKPAYLYARFSSLGQKEGISIERQISYGKAFAEKHGWRIVDELKDEAKSAFKGSNREEGAALYDFELNARNGAFAAGAVLVCENVDRLSRQGAKAAAQLIWSLNEAGVDVATYHDGHIYKAGDDGDLTDLLSVVIKGALGREESQKKSEHSKANWKRIHDHIASGGKQAYSTQCPQWLDIVDGVYVENPHRASILRQIYDWYCDGLGSRVILNKMRESGEKSWSISSAHKERNVWTLSYIHKLLMSRAVMGEYITRDGQTLSTDYYPAVIDPATFFKAQEIRKNRAGIGGDQKKRSVNLLVGISKCGECGCAAVLLQRSKTYKLTTSAGTHTRERKIHHYLKCNASRYRMPSCSNRTYLRYDVVEKVILEKTLPLIVQHKEGAKILHSFDLKMAEYQREIDAKQGQLTNIFNAIAEGVAPKGLVQKAATLEQEIEALEQKISTTKLERNIEAARPSKNKDVEAIQALKDGLASDDETIRFETRVKINTLLSRLLRSVNINDDRTFTVEVDNAFGVTYSPEGNVVGYRLAGNRLTDDMNEALLIDDYGNIVDKAFEQVAPL